jgi:hypothetical protein
MLPSLLPPAVQRSNKKKHWTQIVRSNRFMRKTISPLNDIFCVSYFLGRVRRRHQSIVPYYMRHLAVYCICSSASDTLVHSLGHIQRTKICTEPFGQHWYRGRRSWQPGVTPTFGKLRTRSSLAIANYPMSITVSTTNHPKKPRHESIFDDISSVHRN